MGDAVELMTRAEKELCVFLSLVFTCWGLTDSIQAPFYPIEAASKGATPAQYGLVFGIIHLAIFISSPVFGHYLPRLSLRAVFGFGLVGTSSCACAFGLLPFLPTTAAFLGASYSLRIAEGIAEGAAWSSALTLMANVFGKRSPWVFSLAQASFGFAQILGPMLGGVLFETGGFTLPFVTSGLLCLTVSILALFRLPYLFEENTINPSTPLKKPEDLVKSPQLNRSFHSYSSAPISPCRQALSNPAVLVTLVGTVFGAVSDSFVETFLEEHLAEFDLSITQIGATFLTMSTPLMVATPIFGWLILSIPPVALTLTGYTAVIIALMLVGPPAYLPISPSYLRTEVGLVVLGIGTAAICTSNFARVQRANEDTAHSATLCGLWTAAYALGNFLGPSFGGVMVAQFSFYRTTPLLQVWAVVMLLADILGLILASFRRRGYKSLEIVV